MAPEAGSSVRQRAGGLSADPDAVEGPLSGYHHETYVFPLAAEAEAEVEAAAEALGIGARAGGRGGRWKCREPREQLLWFDRRCFQSEEHLVAALQGRISNVPQVIRVSGMSLQRFIEGRTLGSLHAAGQVVPDALADQILDLFRETTAIVPGALDVQRMCKEEDRAPEADSGRFLERLVCFIEEQVYAENLPTHRGLFDDLGLDPDAFRHLRKRVAGLTERPFCLLHGDLHRENLIVADDGRLWVIDWELAMFGDPLYDLATHLYLMRYPESQKDRVVEGWRGIAEGVRAGNSAGLEEDLERLIDFKRAQSAFTDVIRTSQALLNRSGAPAGELRRGSRKIFQVLRAAAPTLALDSPPGVLEIEVALTRWLTDPDRRYQKRTES